MIFIDRTVSGDITVRSFHCVTFIGAGFALPEGVSPSGSCAFRKCVCG